MLFLKDLSAPYSFVPGPSSPGPNRQYPNGRDRIGGT